MFLSWHFFQMPHLKLYCSYAPANCIKKYDSMKPTIIIRICTLYNIFDIIFLKPCLPYCLLIIILGPRPSSLQLILSPSYNYVLWSTCPMPMIWFAGFNCSSLSPNCRIERVLLLLFFRYTFFRQITIFIKVRVAFVFGLQTL